MLACLSQPGRLPSVVHWEHCSLRLQVREALLPQRLKDTNCRGVSEIQAPRFGADGDSHAAIEMRGKEILRQSLRLLAKKQITAVRIVRLVVALRRFGGKQTHCLHVVFREKVVEIFVVAHVHQMPVIQPCPLDRLVGNVKAQRTNQMQYAPGRRAGSCDVAGVRRNLRLHQNHMQHKTTLPPRKPTFNIL